MQNGKTMKPIKKRAVALTRHLSVMAVSLALTGCASVRTLTETQVSGEGLCAGLAPLADRHADALIALDDAFQENQPPAVTNAIETGADLIEGQDAGCGQSVPS